MKKMLLVGMLVIGGLSYGRDFEYREGQELQVVQGVVRDEQSMISRVMKNMDIYSEFHRDLDTMGRGHESK